MIERALLEYVRRLWPGDWIIAGGYVRDRLLNREPRDVDLFLQGLDIDGLKSSLQNQRVPFVQESRGYRSDPPVRIRFMEYDVHLCHTPYEHGQQIVGSFDFNICRFWLDDDYQAEYHVSDLQDLHAKNMLLQHVYTPVSSMRRGFLFEYRLGMKFLPSDIRKLNEELSEKGVYDV